MQGLALSSRRAHATRSILIAIAIGGCRAEPRLPEMRLWTDDLAIRVSLDPVPPVAREAVRYRIVVRDKESGQPIEGGEGQIFATSQDRRSVWDSFTPGPELGTYYARLRFVTSGDWAVAIRFRRDSTKRLQRADWVQAVRTPAGPGA